MRGIKRAKMIVCGHDVQVVRTLEHARLASRAYTYCQLHIRCHTISRLKFVNKQEFCPWDFQEGPRNNMVIATENPIFRDFWYAWY